MSQRVALITGVTGQDGALLAELLLSKEYVVHGVKRRSSSFNTGRVDHLYEDKHASGRKFVLHHGDLTDATNLIRIVQETQPDEIYNLAAQSHVQVSFETPEYTANADALGTLRLLESLRILGLEKRTRFYQASTSELYGKVQVIRVDYQAPQLNLDGKLDMVLLMREVHMMKNWGTLDAWLREIHRALKPNGILGVEEHRAAPGANAEESVGKGYLPEAWVIEKVEAAGFALAGKSEINANPRDTKDYPNGVWSLPPSFQAGPEYAPADARDRAKYGAIGESDRMTLKFVRVAGGAAR